MCKCKLVSSGDGRSKIIQEIRDFKQQEFIYAALPYGAWSFLSDPQRMIVEDARHADLERLTKYKTNNSLHSKYLIGQDKIIWGSGNFTQSSIFDKHETYEIVEKECHPEKYEMIFSEFKKLWERSTPVKSEIEVKI